MNSILTIAFLIAGTTLLTSTAITTIVPAAYADNYVKAEDDSIAQVNDCDDNELDGNANVNDDFCSNFASVGPPP
ncbi:MAG TPA: hypothetical protein VFS97_14550 [Nitrososphaeraceae archaeon]|nr:hypothetical protein [Nitrososphaeraceae archaeon]